MSVQSILAKLWKRLMLIIVLSVLLGVVLLTFRSVFHTRFVLMQFSALPSLAQGVAQQVLANGLTVLTKEVHTAPVVSVQVWYRVGSSREPAALNGIAHQLEHLMFKGTQQRPIQFGRLFSALGSDSNAFTSYDQTAYFGTTERGKLQALLELEADRMHQVVIDAAQLASEKQVVISELQGYENDPGYRLDRAVMAAAFPDHPYSRSVGGTKATIAQLTVEQVQDYYQTYYSPHNATLVIVGDFDTASTLQLVASLFGNIPAAQPMQTAPPQPLLLPQSASLAEPIVLREPGSAAFLQAVYPLPPMQHPDVPALHLLDLILTEGRNSRLERALIESGLASQVHSYPVNLVGAGWYSLSVTAAPGSSLEQLETILQQTLATLQQQGVTEEELDRAKVQLRTALILWNRDITSQGMLLGNDFTASGDYQFSDRFLRAAMQVSLAEIQQVAQRYLNRQQRTIGFFEPSRTNGDGEIEGLRTTQTVENFSPGVPVDPSEVAQYLPSLNDTMPSSVQHFPETWTLANGLQVLLLEDHSTPIVTLSGYIRAGSEFDPLAKAGLAKLTANGLMNGTQQHDALSLDKILEDRGISLELTANREGVSIAGTAIATDLPVLLGSLAEILQQATFPDNELELNRQQALTELQVTEDEPAQVARRILQQALYPEGHPFYAFPTQSSLLAITQPDLVSFYQTYYRPESTILCLVGDFDPEAVRSQLQQQLGTWQQTPLQLPMQFAPAVTPSANRYLSKILPGKVQAVTYLGSGGITRQDPRFYATLVLNYILGGDTLSSRLGSEIRDRQGLTYGIYSYFQSSIYPGPFIIEMQTDPNDTQRAITATLALLRQLRTQGITETELTTAQRAITSSYIVELAHPESLTNTLLMNAVYRLDPREIQQFSQHVQAVTLAQVNQAIQELIHPEQLVIVTVGSELVP
jgi:zinc protease